MEKIGFIIGESSSISKKEVKNFNAAQIPFILDWEEGDKLQGDNIFQKMVEADKKNIKNFAKTSQPSPFVFKKIFAKELKKFEKIIFISISSKLSGTYNSALQAKKMLEKENQKKVFIFDSLNADVAEILFIFFADKLRKEGKSVEEIIKILEDKVSKVYLIGMLGNPKWLEAGGRLGHSKATILRKMQKIGMRPILGMVSGEIKPIALKMQAKNMSMAIFKHFKSEIEKIKDYKKIKIAISHADNLKGAKELRNEIEKSFERAEIVSFNISSFVIGSHIGPGSIICAWTLQ